MRLAGVPRNGLERCSLPTVGVTLEAFGERASVKLEEMVIVVVELDRPAFAIDARASFAKIEAQ